MKKLLLALLLSMISLQPVIAAEPDAGNAAPTDESISELMTVTGMKALLDNVVQQTDTSMQAKILQSLSGHAVTGEQRVILDDMRNKMIGMMKQTMSWDVLSPKYAAIYKKTFTQEEIDGMLAFYKTPAGKAVITKMPAVTQYSMQLTQALMADLMPKIMKIQQDSIAKLKAAAEKQKRQPSTIASAS
ncbi:MAG TPA: DUF2059 domain-containing protein [Herbaspirillum sp.]